MRKEIFVLAPQKTIENETIAEWCEQNRNGHKSDQSPEVRHHK